MGENWSFRNGSETTLAASVLVSIAPGICFDETEEELSLASTKALQNSMRWHVMVANQSFHVGSYDSATDNGSYTCAFIVRPIIPCASTGQHAPIANANSICATRLAPIMFGRSRTHSSSDLPMCENPIGSYRSLFSKAGFSDVRSLLDLTVQTCLFACSWLAA